MTSSSNQETGFTLSSVIDKYWQKHREGDGSSEDLNVTSKGIPSTALHVDAKAERYDDGNTPGSKAANGSDNPIPKGACPVEANGSATVDSTRKENGVGNHDRSHSVNQADQDTSRNNLTTDHGEKKGRTFDREHGTSGHENSIKQRPAHNSPHDSPRSRSSEVGGSKAQPDTPSIKPPGPMNDLNLDPRISHLQVAHLTQGVHTTDTLSIMDGPLPPPQRSGH